MRKLPTFLFALSMLSAIASRVHSEEAQKNQPFAAFWSQFKAAVAKNDKEAVTAMTKFPVEIGENVTKAAFLKKYPEIFTRKVQGCFAKEKPVRDEDRGSYSLFCGQDIFLFEKVDGKYQFTGIGEND